MRSRVGRCGVETRWIGTARLRLGAPAGSEEHRDLLDWLSRQPGVLEVREAAEPAAAGREEGSREGGSREEGSREERAGSPRAGGHPSPSLPSCCCIPSHFIQAGQDLL